MIYRGNWTVEDFTCQRGYFLNLLHELANALEIGVQNQVARLRGSNVTNLQGRGC